MSLTPGTLLTLTIEKPAAGGRMIARADGRIVLVNGTIPGERVVARIDRVAKGVAYAEATTIENPSPDRREPYADPVCGGCLYSHIAYERQLEIKAQVIADAFARIGKLELPADVHVAASREDGYRMRARLHVRGGRAGFFREGTHDLCDARATRQLLPESCDAVEEIAASLGRSGTDTREIELSENVSGTERGIAFDGQIVAGEPYVHDALAIDGQNVSWRRHVLAFFQGNRYLLGGLVTHVVGAVEQGVRVVDLYAGAGLFTIPAAVARGAHVTAVEGDRAAAADLAWNANRIGAGAVDALHQPVEAFVERTTLKPDTLIVDPPRTGMSKEAVSGAIRLRARTLVYVSCDVATLARDARKLVEAGYAIARVNGFDMFPNTPHVEVVVIFTRG